MPVTDSAYYKYLSNHCLNIFLSTKYLICVQAQLHVFEDQQHIILPFQNQNKQKSLKKKIPNLLKKLSDQNG